MQCLSVRLSVTFVNSVKTSNRICNILSPSGSQTILLFHTKRYGDILTGASNAGGVGTNRDSGRIAGYRSMTAAVRDQQLTVQ